MKNIVLIALIFCSALAFAQQDRTLTHNKNTDLIDVVYYHDNGQISQTGSYTLDGKLQGDWFSYDHDGNKIAAAKYNKGEKTGKWFFWEGNVLKEVDYSKNKIANVVEWNKTNIAARD